MDLVFASDSIWVWDAEKNFAKLKEENPKLIKTTKSDPETGLVASRRPSHVSAKASDTKPAEAEDKIDVSHH